MKDVQAEEIKSAVRNRYGNIAREGASCCGSAPSAVSLEDFSKKLGYSGEELESLPEGANMGLGCGNPQAIAELRSGEVVLDLGSGGGLDCFLAARQVGPSGRVIGVDMTPEMLAKARGNAARSGQENVEFRLGEIEHLPVADASVDVILSNCVINLSPDKRAVYREAYRVLKPGGRLAISDMVAKGPIPGEVRANMDLHSSCVAGAEEIGAQERMLAEAGFQNVSIQPKEAAHERLRDPSSCCGAGVEDLVVSATIQAVKPGA